VPIYRDFLGFVGKGVQKAVRLFVQNVECKKNLLTNKKSRGIIRLSPGDRGKNKIVPKWYGKEEHYENS
jgi:hypothetical protein